MVAYKLLGNSEVLDEAERGNSLTVIVWKSLKYFNNLSDEKRVAALDRNASYITKNIRNLYKTAVSVNV